MGTAWHELYTVSVALSRAGRDAPDTAGAAVLYGNPVSLSPGEPIPGSESLTKKRELFPADVSHFVCVAARGPREPISVSRARMHHKVVGNFRSEADVRSLYYRR